MRWIVILVLTALAGCTHSSPPPTAPDPAITVGSFNFPESVALAQLYAEALRTRGYAVRLLPDVGPREIVGPALGRGLLDLVPEYAGSALTFFTVGMPASHDPGTTHAALLRAVAGRGLIALAPAPAQDANAFVVTAATANRYHLQTISDLAPFAADLLLGGPPECPQRPLCLQGLRERYGLRFRAFVPTDTGGPLTLAALLGGDIDVAKLDTTSPAIWTHHLVVLDDDRGLQPAENVTPVVRKAVLDRYGPALAARIDAVSAALTSADLTELTLNVVADPDGAPLAARRWLADHGLA